MKKILNFAAILLLLTSVFACGKEDEIVSLKDTKWKLVEFVHVSERTTKTPEPQSDQCYWIFFDSDTTFSGITSTNEVRGIYRINPPTSTIYIDNIGGTKINELFDGNLYVERLLSVSFFELTKTSLKLYYNETDYLLFKPYEP
jgi:hypothetical protein